MWKWHEHSVDGIEKGVHEGRKNVIRRARANLGIDVVFQNPLKVGLHPTPESVVNRLLERF